MCLLPNHDTRSFVSCSSSMSSSRVRRPPFSCASLAATRALARKERWTLAWNVSEKPIEVESPRSVGPDAAVGEIER
jgi:hypothetical protein